LPFPEFINNIGARMPGKRAINSRNPSKKLKEKEHKMQWRMALRVLSTKKQGPPVFCRAPESKAVHALFSMVLAQGYLHLKIFKSICHTKNE
jgi:hypothetical protein